MISDFLECKIYFLSLGEKSLSNYQKTNAPILVDLVTCFFQFTVCYKVT